MTFRFIAFLIAFLAIAAAGVQPAVAQGPTLSSSVAPAIEYRLGPGEEKSFTWTIVAAGAQAASVQVTPTLLVPPGWTATSDQLEPFTLGGPNGQNSRSIPIKLALPPTASEVASGDLILRASGSTAAGAVQPTQQTVTLTYIAPIIPPAPVPPDYTWAIVSGILGVLVLIGAGVYVLQARRVRLAIDSPVKRFNIGTGGSYKVVVTNPSRVPQNVQLRVRDLPKEWSAAFSFPVVPLNAGERSEVPLWVNVPPEAPANLHQGFRIQARPNRFSPWIVSRRLQVDTLDVSVTQKPV